MALEPSTRFGSYEVSGSIGSGGMGEVYQATDTTLERDVAIKVLPESFAADADRVARFRQEAKTLASLNHANIAQVYGLEQADGQTAIVMELVEGPTLEDRISQGPIPLEESLGIAAQVANALEAAHSKQIIHRDLKPANIKLTPEGVVKLLDFGIAKLPEPTNAASGGRSPTLLTPALTEAGVLLGTAAYMSPEQAKGRSVDQRTDIWAFGCVLYEMLTGQPAFGAEDVTTTLARIIEREANFTSLPSEASPAVRRTIELCLRKDPRDRIRDIGDVRLALAGAFDAGGSTGDGQHSGARRSKGSRLLAGIALVTSIAALTLAFIHFGEVPPERQVLHFSIPLPALEGAAEGLFFNHEISPDGRYLAATGVLAQEGGIFVRALASDEWNLLGGTSTGTLFWIDDGQAIGSFTEEGLARVDVGGGPIEVIGPLGPGNSFQNGGATSANGEIVFAPPAGGGLMRVSLPGSEPMRLTTAEPGSRHAFPHFLPDGRKLVYTVEGGEAPGIYLASLDEPTGRRLLPDQSSAIYGPSSTESGYLIFEREGQLMAQAFDAETETMLGRARVIVGRSLWNDTGSIAASVSKNGILTYLGGRSRTTDSRLVWLDRSGQEIGAFDSVGSESSVSLSPDGQFAAVNRRQPPADYGDIWVLDLNRGIANPFTFEGSVRANANVVWSPDEDRIAYVEETGSEQRIVLADIDSAGDQNIVYASENLLYVTDWSERGELIFTEISGQTGADIKYLRPDSESLDIVVFRSDPFSTSFGQVSPNGRWIAYVSNETGGAEIWVDEFPTGRGRWRVTASGATVGTTQQPRWRRDGSELYLFSGAGGRATLSAAPVAATAAAGESPIGRAEPLFAARINSYDPTQGTYFYDVAEDGERFLVNITEERVAPHLNVVVNWEESLAAD